MIYVYETTHDALIYIDSLPVYSYIDLRYLDISMGFCIS